MSDRPTGPFGIDALHFSFTLFVLLVLFVLYLLLPRGLRVQYFKAYPKRYAWSARSRARRTGRSILQVSEILLVFCLAHVRPSRRHVHGVLYNAVLKFRYPNIWEFSYSKASFFGPISLFKTMQLSNFLTRSNSQWQHETTHKHTTHII